ncbi:MAG: HEAT repeat domain-containing protein [bacterium]
MNALLLAVTVSMMLTTGPSQTHSAPAIAPRSAPPAAWAAADPADSLYRAARRALTDKDYDEAVRLFDSIYARYPRSEYAPDALYWKGFALYRNGDLDRAADVLELQAKQYPNASTRRDGATLLILVKGEQAKRGDSEARRDVTAAATSAQGATCAGLDMQVAALDALQQMDSERVIPLLRKVLARRDACSVKLRKNALFILAQKSGAEREKILLDVAKSDPSSEVQQEAIFHLSQVNSPAAVDALEELLKSGESVPRKKAALFALANSGSDRGRAAVRALVLSDDAPQTLRNEAIFDVASMKEPEGVTWLRDNYSKVRDEKLRGEIMFHIASHPNAESTKWLGEVALDPKEPKAQRSNAVFHLASAKGGVSMLSSLYDRASADVKKDIIFQIASRHDNAGLEKLIQIAKSDSSMTMRKEALFQIGQSKDPRALKALEEIVSP